MIDTLHRNKNNKHLSVKDKPLKPLEETIKEYAYMI